MLWHGWCKVFCWRKLQAFGLSSQRSPDILSQAEAKVVHMSLGSTVQATSKDQEPTYKQHLLKQKAHCDTKQCQAAQPFHDNPEITQPLLPILCQVKAVRLCTQAQSLKPLGLPPTFPNIVDHISHVGRSAEEARANDFGELPEKGITIIVASHSVAPKEMSSFIYPPRRPRKNV